MHKVRQNLRYLFIAAGIVFVWRGIWGLADIYLIPSNPTLSFIVSIGIGIVLLLLHEYERSDLRELE